MPHVRCLMFVVWCQSSDIRCYLMSDVWWQMSDICCLLSDVWFCCLMSGIWYQTSDVCCLLWDVWCLMSDFWCLFVRRLISDVWCLLSHVSCQTSDFFCWCQTSDVSCQTWFWCLLYGIRCQTTDVRHLISDIWCLMSDVWCLLSDIIPIKTKNNNFYQPNQEQRQQYSKLALWTFFYQYLIYTPTVHDMQPMIIIIEYMLEQIIVNFSFNFFASKLCESIPMSLKLSPPNSFRAYYELHLLSEQKWNNGTAEFLQLILPCCNNSLLIFPA